MQQSLCQIQQISNLTQLHIIMSLSEFSMPLKFLLPKV